MTKRNKEKRWKEHVREALFEKRAKPRNCYFYNAIRKHGAENFELETICFCDTKVNTLEAEKFFIWFNGSCKSSIGYNGTFGGEGGNHTPETGKKIAASNLGKKRGPHKQETKDKISKSNLGRTSKFKGTKRDPEIGKKISEAKKGMIYPEKGKKKLSEFNTGKVIPQEVRDKISKTTKGRPGRIPSEEEKQKISKTLSGRKLTPEHIAAMKLGWEKRRERLAKEKECHNQNQSQNS